ncbi:MAG: ABC-F family ATP-binding cassette domain-containing protein [Deltaproteobacteria bacterium]|nr:ABC-F family ATP-binding cassette domain-containing protein [Deltaproteobacteria bacterium]
MPVIDCSALGKSYGERSILRDVTLTIRSRERVGLVGNNGSGKSTLGRILAGVEESDAGGIARRRGSSVDYLPQEPRLPGSSTVRDVVLESLSEWNGAKRRHDALTAALGEAGADHERLVAEQASAGEAVERLGGWERLHEAEAIIGHLGIEDSSRRIDTLSGGEKRRVALARLLVGEPDLAILDEPTNHLDIETIEWLEEHMRDRFEGALLLITHDRYVLDRVTSRTLELHEGRVTSYRGGYGDYLEAKSERQAHAERVERNRQNFLRRELEWLRRQPKARATKQKARIGRAQEAMDREGPQRERSADLRMGTERLGKTILELQGLGLERAGHVLTRDLDLALTRGERIGIVGANGCGKTSLLLCLTGELEPTAGSVTLGTNTHLGYLDQARRELDDEETIRESVAGEQSSIEIAGETLQVGAYLERFLFDRGSQRSKVGVLSGGERARVCLARLLWRKTNLLLLDEPTNDLDVATLAALEAMLLEYPGSALIVSHDRWFLDRVATSILAFEDGARVELHRGNYSDYRERRRAQEGASAQERRAERKKEAAPEAPPTRGQKKLSLAEERELEGLFDEIEAAEGRVEALLAQLADPATYEQDRSAVAELQRDLEDAQRHTGVLTARWEELEARKAAATEGQRGA